MMNPARFLDDMLVSIDFEVSEMSRYPMLIKEPLRMIHAYPTVDEAKTVLNVELVQ